MSEAQKAESVNEFIISGRLPSLNDYTRACRSHWSKGAHMKRRVEEDIGWYILAARGAHKLHPVYGPVTLAIEWHESDRRRDLDNIVSAKKFILDAMQKMGIIPNDDREHVRAISEEIVDDDKDFVVVRIYEVKE